MLTGLVRKEVLSIQADPRSPEHGQYAFLQDLVRHVVYEQLSRRERHARHLAAADQLAESAADPSDVIEVLASHYLAAFRSAPDEVGGDGLRERALSALVAAGEHANALGAPSEAQRYFEQAVELSDDRRQQADLTAKAGGAACLRADHLQESNETLARAIALYEELGDTHAAATGSRQPGRWWRRGPAGRPRRSSGWNMPTRRSPMTHLTPTCPCSSCVWLESVSLRAGWRA